MSVDILSNPLAELDFYFQITSKMFEAENFVQSGRPYLASKVKLIESST
jgi:hypothetical protein